MKKKQNKVIYYTDPLNDDFAGTNIEKIRVDENFKYIHKSIIWRFFSFLIYRCIVYPIIWFYLKIILRVKFVNKKALRELKGSTYFLYGNHTSFLDAFIPHIISMPKRNRIITSQDTVSIKGIKNLVQMLGAVPLSDNIQGMKEFINSLEYFHKKDNITIYPEAHIWPYYTGVRPFLDKSFRYPVKLNSPVVAFFTAYSKPKGFLSKFRKANITVYINKPIYPNQSLPLKERQKDLRDRVYNFMNEQKVNSDYEVISYKHISEKPNDN